MTAPTIKAAWLRVLADDPRLFGHDNPTFGEQVSAALMDGVEALNRLADLEAERERDAERLALAEKLLHDAVDRGAALEAENARLREERDRARRKLAEWSGRAELEGRTDGMTLESYLAGEAEPNDSARVLIYSGEHRLWWRERGGYTANESEAGIFTFADALSRAGHCGPEKQIVFYPAAPEATNG